MSFEIFLLFLGPFLVAVFGHLVIGFLAFSVMLGIVEKMESSFWKAFCVWLYMAAIYGMLLLEFVDLKHMVFHCVTIIVLFLFLSKDREVSSDDGDDTDNSVNLHNNKKIRKWKNR